MHYPGLTNTDELPSGTNTYTIRVQYRRGETTLHLADLNCIDFKLLLLYWI